MAMSLSRAVVLAVNRTRRARRRGLDVLDVLDVPPASGLAATPTSDAAPASPRSSLPSLAKNEYWHSPTTADRPAHKEIVAWESLKNQERRLASSRNPPGLLPLEHAPSSSSARTDPPLVEAIAVERRHQGIRTEATKHLERQHLRRDGGDISPHRLLRSVQGSVKRQGFYKREDFSR